MKKITILSLFSVVSLLPSHLLAMEINLNGFRFNRYVYYQVLYKVQGIKTTLFNDIIIKKETPKQLFFEYQGQEYKAFIMSHGMIYVDMPSNLRDRYLSRDRFPAVIL